jgi:galactokinase
MPSLIRRYVVPGRVELVGKHVDYAGGRSLTCAIDLALHIDAETMSEPVLRVDAGPERGSAVMPLNVNATPTDASWSVYVAARRSAIRARLPPLSARSERALER